MVTGSCRMYLERYNMDNEQKLYNDNFATEGQLKRIADALDLIIKMVKEDQERSRKYMEERKDD